jgi:hypothetical protein
MRLNRATVQSIVTRVLKSEDYRADILALINAEFLDYAIDFFGRVAQAKLRNASIDEDWYKREFILNPSLSSEDITIHAGLNTKTINNSFGSTKRQVILEVVPQYYDNLYALAEGLAHETSDIDITLTIKLRGVSVELNITESLIVINTLAVKRAQLRGGAWSSAGKNIEKYLMLALCGIFSVPSSHYALTGTTLESREVDFVLLSTDGKPFACEVKLMGKGNPESADAVIARDSVVFIADTLSSQNKRQLSQRGVRWVELSQPNGFMKFYDVLITLGVPCQPFTGDLAASLEAVFSQMPL